MREAVISMIIHEVPAERLSFTSTGCGTTSSAYYDVQHGEGRFGHDRDYYLDNGLPCPGTNKTAERAAASLLSSPDRGAA